MCNGDISPKPAALLPAGTITSMPDRPPRRNKQRNTGTVSIPRGKNQRAVLLELYSRHLKLDPGSHLQREQLTTHGIKINRKNFTLDGEEQSEKAIADAIRSLKAGSWILYPTGKPSEIALTSVGLQAAEYLRQSGGLSPRQVKRSNPTYVQQTKLVLKQDITELQAKIAGLRAAAETITATLSPEESPAAWLSCELLKMEAGLLKIELRQREQLLADAYSFPSTAQFYGEYAKQRLAEYRTLAQEEGLTDLADFAKIAALAARQEWEGKKGRPSEEYVASIEASIRRMSEAAGLYSDSRGHPAIALYELPGLIGHEIPPEAVPRSVINQAGIEDGLIRWIPRLTLSDVRTIWLSTLKTHARKRGLTL